MKRHERKRRTREHVIADLSVNHVERSVLLCGFTAQRVTHDYGVDLLVNTFTDDGEVEEGMILLQLKATDGLKRQRPFVSWPIERADLVSWLRQPMPVILAVYDAQKDVAFWLYVQSYFRQRRGFNLFAAGKTITVRLPRENIINPQAIRRFAQFRDSALQQIEVIHEEN